jgi:tetratricopeptide (TPR) repeat protein
VADKRIAESFEELAMPLFASLYNFAQWLTHDEAEPLYQRALDFDEGSLRETHSETATSLNNLGALYYSQERYPEAEELFRRELSIDESSRFNDISVV